MPRDNERCPPTFSIVERNAYRRGWRDGHNGKDQGVSRWPQAYSRGFWEGVAAAQADKARLGPP